MKPTKSRPFSKTFAKNKFSFLKETLFSLIIFFIMLLIISNPARYSKSTINGVNLFITAVFPGLFPFMLLTKLLTELGFAFKITNKCGKFTRHIFGTPPVSLYVFFMSILSGYPIGAKIIADLFEKGQISESDAKKMSVFCTTSGPIFVIGAVGVGMFSSFEIGLILYFSHILSSLILGISYHLLTRKKSKEPAANNQIIVSTSGDNIFANCVTQTINSIFVVGAYITIFYLITEICESLNILSALANGLQFLTRPFKVSAADCKSLAYGFLEVTRGCKSFAASATRLSVSLCSGIISFSGVSIIMQSMAFLKNTKIKMHSFAACKLMHFCVSTFLCYMLLIVFM